MAIKKKTKDFSHVVRIVFKDGVTFYDRYNRAGKSVEKFVIDNKEDQLTPEEIELFCLDPAALYKLFGTAA